MKRVTLFLMTMLLGATMMWAAGTSGGAAVSLNVNNGQDAVYSMNDADWEDGANAKSGNVGIKVDDGAAAGYFQINDKDWSANVYGGWTSGITPFAGHTWTNPASLVLTEATAIGWAKGQSSGGENYYTDGSWVIKYRVYKQGTTAPVWSDLALTIGKDAVTSADLIDNDNYLYNWGAGGTGTTDILSLTSGDGTYIFEITYVRTDFWQETGVEKSFTNPEYDIQTATIVIVPVTVDWENGANAKSGNVGIKVDDGAAAGYFQINDKDWTTNVYYSWASGITPFNGKSWTDPASLKITEATAIGWARGHSSGGENYFKDGSWVIKYRVYKQGTAAPAWTDLVLTLGTDAGTGADLIDNDNYLYNKLNQTIDLLATVTDAATYNFELTYVRTDFWKENVGQPTEAEASYANDAYATQTATITRTTTSVATLQQGKGKLVSGKGFVAGNVGEAATVQIYSLQGALLNSFTAAGSFTAALPAGVYVVKVDGNIYKTAVY